MKEEMALVTWPDVQKYMDLEDWELNSSLANDERIISTYGSSCYWVNIDWLYKADKYLFEIEELRGLNEADIY